jgi:hypothetical protein
MSTQHIMDYLAYFLLCSHGAAQSCNTYQSMMTQKQDAQVVGSDRQHHAAQLDV